MTYGTAAVALSAVLLAGCFGNSAEQFLAAAKTEIGKNDRGAAIIQLKNSLQKNPSLPEARFLLGKVLLESGDVRGAMIELGKARELGYSEDMLVPTQAQAMLIQGQFEKLVNDFSQTKLSSPAAIADLQTSLASAYGSLGKLPQAIASVEAALAADGSYVRAQLVQVRLLAGSGGSIAALAAVDKVIAGAPKNAEAWQVKGDLLAFTNKSDDAIAAFRQAITLDKNNMAAQAGVLTLLIAKKDFDGAQKQLAGLRALKPNHPQTLLYTAAIALEKNELKLARENIQQLLKIAPDDVRVLHMAGAVEFRLGALLQTESYLNKALKSAPNSPKIRILLAQTHLRGGDPSKAIAALQPLLGAQGTDVEALGVAAEAYLQLGDAKRAEEYFSKASKLDPKDVRSRTALALVQVSKGKAEQGLAELRSIASSDASPVADMALISALLQRRDVEQALKAIDALEGKTPGKPTAANLRGRIEIVRGNKDKARQSFEAALKIDPVFFPAAASLANLDLETKQTDAAVARFQKILAIEPNSLQANMAVIALRDKSGASKEEVIELLSKLVKQLPTEATPRLALIRVQMDRKESKLALAAAQDAVAALPDNPDVWAVLGQLMAITGDTNQAVSAFNKLIALQPNAPEPHLRLAEVYASKKDSVAAMQSLRRALSVKADYLPAQTALLSMELEAGRFSEARGIAQTIQTQRAADPLGHALGGDVEASQKNWNAATSNYRAALNKRASSELAVKLHRALMAGGKQIEAKKFETEWLADHAQDAIFKYHMADVALGQENYALAEQLYLNVLKIQPDNAAATNNLAWLLHKTKKPGALEFAEKANKLRPDQPALMDTLAEIYAGAGKLEKALEVQKRAVALGPDLAVHRLHLAQFYIAAGQKPAAREELMKLAALGDKWPQQAEIKRLLATL